MDAYFIEPATALFVDTLNYQRGLLYLGSEVCASPWMEALIICAMDGILLSFVYAVLHYDFYRNGSRFRKFMIVWGLVCGTLYAGYKNIIDKSAADDGITLAEVYAGATNGVSRIDVKAFGGVPEPVWYRNTKDQTWIKATDEGWSLDYAIDDGNMHVRGWVHPSTNDSVTAYNMWYFGSNPPAVEIIEQGGVTITGFSVSGRAVQITYEISDDVELYPGSVLTIESCTDIGDGIVAWQTEYVDEAPKHGKRSVGKTGFRLRHKTIWRVRLEVPE